MPLRIRETEAQRVDFALTRDADWKLRVIDVRS